MSTEHSKACCENPVAVAGPYQEKGEWTTVDGLKTYITGPKTATKAILYNYDIFGLQPQTIQGADILSSSSAKSPYLVIMPDWFEGDAVKREWFPPQTDEQRKLIGEFIQTKGSPDLAAPRMLTVIEKLKAKYPTVERWGAVGFCWGAKVVSIVAAKGEESPLAVGAQSSPARIDPEEAKKIKIPMAFLPSGEEDAETSKNYVESLGGEKYAETFGSQVHGWMSARADLEKDEVRSEYERGYKVLIDFFDKYL